MRLRRCTAGCRQSAENGRVLLRFPVPLPAGIVCCGAPHPAGRHRLDDPLQWSQKLPAHALSAVSVHCHLRSCQSAQWMFLQIWWGWKQIRRHQISVRRRIHLPRVAARHVQRSRSVGRAPPPSVPIVQCVVSQHIRVVDSSSAFEWPIVGIWWHYGNWLYSPLIKWHPNYSDGLSCEPSCSPLNELPRNPRQLPPFQFHPHHRCSLDEVQYCQLSSQTVAPSAPTKAIRFPAPNAPPAARCYRVDTK